MFPNNGAVLPLNAQWSQYPYYPGSLAPMMTQQQAGMVVPQMTNAYPGAALTNQMMSYIAANPNMDAVTYNSYLSLPPEDIQYAVDQPGSCTACLPRDPPVESCRCAPRQPCRTTCKKVWVLEPVPPKKLMTYVRPVSAGMARRAVTTYPAGGYYA